MIKKVIIKNYRCFEKCEINFKDLAIAVGRNNAGKSTFIEALRIVAIGVNRSSNINYTSPPYWLNIDQDLLGISPSIDNLDISTNNIFYRYGSPPSLIKTFFDNGVTIETYVGEDAKIFVLLYNADGKM